MVGYTRLKKGWCFKCNTYRSYLKQHVFLSTLTPLSKKSVKKWRCAGQKSISGWRLKGGHKKNGFPQIVISSKLFKTIFMSWNIDLGSMNSFPLLKLKFRLILFEKRSFWSILGGCVMFFFWWLCNPHLRSKSKFQVLNIKKIQKTTYYESLKIFSILISSV